MALVIYTYRKKLTDEWPLKLYMLLLFSFFLF